ncbi:MAG: hypothetical protein WCT44_00475 [Candidatus Paceibacterota bacterium]
MINLIPKEEKKKMTRGFYLRLFVLFIGVLNFCILVAAISLLPAYFSSSVNDTFVDTQLENQKNEPLPVLGEQSLLAVKDINNKIDLIENARKDKFIPSSQVINAILLEKRADIKLTQIFYEQGPTGGRKIKITGTAPSREVLLLFRQALEKSASFKSVDLPISNFVKGADIQFYLSIVPA